VSKAADGRIHGASSGFDSGTGGYYDRCVDWDQSVERHDNCNSRS